MFTFLYISLLQLAFTYKILFVPRTYRLFTQTTNEIYTDYNHSYLLNKNITYTQIQSFMEKIKRKKEDDFFYEKEVWDDGEVEW
jgi:hypothetical protein